MKLYLPSMSGLERASVCPASQVLPHNERRRGGGLWQSRGRILHRFLQQVPELGREEALALVPSAFRDHCSIIDLDMIGTLSGDAYAAEVAFALDIYAGTARELGRGLSREEAYKLAHPHELVGTVDVLGLTDDAVVVYDYKTGYRWFEAVEQNWQLLAYAIAAALAFDRGHGYLGIIRVPEHGEPYFIRGEVSLLDIERGLQALRDLNDQVGEMRLRQLAGEQLPQVTGDHCKFCPASAACPAIARLQRRLTSPKGLRLPSLSPASAPQYVEAVRRAKQAVEMLEEKLDAYAAQNPIELENGRVYGPRPYPNNHFNVDRALPILEEVLDGEAALECVKEVRAITIERMEDAIRNLAKRRAGVKLGKTKKKVLKQLAERGAMHVTFTYPIGEHKPKKDLTEGTTNGEGHDEEAAGEALGDAPGEAAG